MNILRYRAEPLSGLQKELLSMTILALFILFPGYVLADIADHIAQCAAIGNDIERLKCFDSLAGRGSVKKPAAALPAKNDKPRQTEAAATVPPADEKQPAPSVMSRHWELDPASREKAPVIRAHRPNYLLPAAYVSSPNKDTSLDVDPDARAQNNEAKFQLSFKVKLWEDVAGKDMDLWFAYTQLAFWQLYNSAFSSPFRETNYEPEVLLNFRTDYDILGLKGRIVNLGINHQSNGRAKPLSRSWNRIVANFGFERNNFNLLLKTWYRIPENEQDDDNPDIDKYLGYGEIWGYYYVNKHRLAAMWRNNLRPGDNRGAVQLDWSFPLPFIHNERLSGYIQYFNGYGESLLDYNANVNRIGIGIMLTDWH